jgi:hypothetical protein
VHKNQWINKPMNISLGYIYCFLILRPQVIGRGIREGKDKAFQWLREEIDKPLKGKHRTSV